MRRHCITLVVALLSAAAVGQTGPPAKPKAGRSSPVTVDVKRQQKALDDAIAAVRKEFRGCVIREIAREDDRFEIGGKMANGKAFEAQISEDGAIEYWRRQIDPAKLPRQIVRAIMARLPEAKPIAVWEASEAEEEEEEEDLYVVELKVGKARMTAEVGYSAEEDEVFGSIAGPVRVRNLPRAVAAAAKKHLKVAEIGSDGEGRMVQKVIELEEDEPGQDTSYRWELERPARQYSVTADGKVVLVEQEMAEADLPKTVRQAVRKAYAKAKLVEIRKVTRNGAVSYRMEATFGYEGIEIRVTPDGKVSEELY